MCNVRTFSARAHLREARRMHAAGSLWMRLGVAPGGNIPNGKCTSRQPQITVPDKYPVRLASCYGVCRYTSNCGSFTNPKRPIRPAVQKIRTAGDLCGTYISL